MKTYSPKPRDIERRWYVIDASGAVLGRLATEVASILRGKHKPIFAPHMDTGDHVIVVNASGVQLTGGKENKKVAYRHSGYPGGLTATGYAKLMAERPAFVVEKAVKGMLPKNSLGRTMVKKLQVYAGPEHPHQAQQPQPLKLGEIPRWEGLPAPTPAAAREPVAPGRGPTERAAKRTTARRTSARASTAKRTAAEASTTEGSAQETPERATSAAKKSTAKKSTAKKSTAKKSTAKKSTAKKSTAKKSTAKKSTAKKSTAKKSTARRAKKEE